MIAPARQETTGVKAGGTRAAPCRWCWRPVQVGRAPDPESPVGAVGAAPGDDWGTRGSGAPRGGAHRRSPGAGGGRGCAAAAADAGPGNVGRRPGTLPAHRAPGLRRLRPGGRDGAAPDPARRRARGRPRGGAAGRPHRPERARTAPGPRGSGLLRAPARPGPGRRAHPHGRRGGSVGPGGRRPGLCRRAASSPSPPAAMPRTPRPAGTSWAMSWPTPSSRGPAPRPCAAPRRRHQRPSRRRSRPRDRRTLYSTASGPRRPRGFPSPPGPRPWTPGRVPPSSRSRPWRRQACA